MKSPIYSAALAAAAMLTGLSSVQAAPSPPIPFSAWMTDSMIRRGVLPSYRYDQATLYTSLEAVIAHSGNQTIRDFYRDQIDTIVFPNGTISGFNHSHYSLDPYRYGNNLLYWYEQTGEEKYRIAASNIKATLDKHPRTPTGGFWHRDVVYPNQMWLDGIYMADSFYAKYVRMFQPENMTAWDDIVLQFDKIDAITKRADNLRVHGYDESKKAVWADPVTGAAPLAWGRAMGWYYMSLLEVIQLLPPSHPGVGKLKGYFVSLTQGLKDAQDETGGWWNVMEKRYEDVEGNYIESSAGAMFTFGLLRGLRLGYISKKDYLATTIKAWKKGLVDKFITYNQDGTINFEGTVEVGSLGSNATFEYYASIKVRPNDLRGAGAFIIAAVEWEKSGLCA